MIVGFNHNITYRGVCFHVQTEDSGIKTPHLITLLYHGGTIISSQKTSYADILNVDNLDSVIEDLAKEQHKGMLRRLKKGEFDQRIVDYGIKITPLEQSPEMAVSETAAVPPSVSEEPGMIEEQVASPVNENPETINPPDDKPIDLVLEDIAEPGSATTDLDDLIFSYLSGDDGKA